MNGPGAWNFSDLHAAEPLASREFYTAGFGWRFDDLGFATMIGRPGYGDHLEATVDPDIRSRQSQVHAPVTFSIADGDDFVTLAERLGGQVLAADES